MPSIRLGGYESAPDFLAKARRELKRFKNADAQQDRADHALNVAVTLHHLGDWTYRHGMQLGLAMGDSRNFLGNARNANVSVKLLHKIADTTKHHTLDNQNVLKIEVDELGDGRITHHQDFVGINVQPPRTDLPGGRPLNVRTVIDDDEIVGYETVYEGTVVSNGGVGQFFDPICENAISFWSAVIQNLDNGQLPDWMRPAQD
jgi:hypothetical protein